MNIAFLYFEFKLIIIYSRTIDVDQYSEDNYKVLYFIQVQVLRIKTTRKTRQISFVPELTEIIECLKLNLAYRLKPIRIYVSDGDYRNIC